MADQHPMWKVTLEDTISTGIASPNAPYWTSTTILWKQLPNATAIWGWVQEQVQALGLIRAGIKIESERPVPSAPKKYYIITLTAPRATPQSHVLRFKYYLDTPSVTAARENAVETIEMIGLFPVHSFMVEEEKTAT